MLHALKHLVNERSDPHHGMSSGAMNGRSLNSSHGMRPPALFAPTPAATDGKKERPPSPETPWDGLTQAHPAALALPGAPLNKVAMVAPAATSGAGADPLVQVINFHREAGEDEDMEEEDESEFGEEDEDEMAEAETGARASGKATVPYVCGMCGKGFKKKSLMTAHERIHNDDRPYACMDCPKAFRDLGALNSHKIRLHSRENLKFSCELCSKRFRYQRELDIHARMHTGDKPYQCGLCDKTFTQVGNHRSHVRRHLFRHCYKKSGTGTASDGTESGECLLCGDWLANLDEMNSHTKIHTSDEDVARLRKLKANVFWSREMPTGKRYKAPPSEASTNVERKQSRKASTASAAAAARMPGKENSSAGAHVSKPPRTAMTSAVADNESALQAAMALAAFSSFSCRPQPVPMVAEVAPRAPLAGMAAGMGVAGGYYVFVPAPHQQHAL